MSRPLEEVEEESLNDSSYLLAELWDSVGKSSKGLDLEREEDREKRSNKERIWWACGGEGGVAVHVREASPRHARPPLQSHSKQWSKMEL